MPPPTQKELEFKEKLETMMKEYNVTFKVAVMPVGNLSKFIHFLTKHIYSLSSTVAIVSLPDETNETPELSKSRTYN